MYEARLGPTNSQLNYMAKKPLPFRYQRFSLCVDPTTTRILIPTRSISPYEKTSALIEHQLTTYFLTKAVSSIGSEFSPVHFRGIIP